MNKYCQLKILKSILFFLELNLQVGIAVNFGNIPQIDVKEENIKSALRHTNAHIRIHELVNLYVDPLMAYMKEEEIPVNLWLVVIPEVILLMADHNQKLRKLRIIYTLSFQKRF